MDLFSKKTILDLLKKYNTKPLKGLGQNFLIDRNILRKIIESASLKKDDIILEIGPGIGILTQELAKRVKRAITIEKDPKMVEILKDMMKDFKNIEIIQGDILKIEPKTYNLKPKTYKIVANLPFYITSPVIRKFLENHHPPKEMILMVQKEVAQRICAKPPKMNLLAVSIQFYAAPKILFYISKESFWPKPKVDAALLKISQIRTNLPPIDIDLFFKIVKAGFSQPRKQLVNNFSKKLNINKNQIIIWFLENNISSNQRADNLTINNWIKLTKKHFL